MIKVKVKEPKVILYTDPNYFGAEVDDSAGEGLSIQKIRLEKITPFEPEEKMQQQDAKIHVAKLLKKLESGEELDPILVRNYKSGFQVIDGHHRFHAYKLAKKQEISAKVIPSKDIKVVKQKGD